MIKSIDEYLERDKEETQSVEEFLEDEETELFIERFDGCYIQEIEQGIEKWYKEDMAFVERLKKEKINPCIDDSLIDPFFS